MIAKLLLTAHMSEDLLHQQRWTHPNGTEKKRESESARGRDAAEQYNSTLSRIVTRAIGTDHFRRGALTQNTHSRGSERKSRGGKETRPGKTKGRRKDGNAVII